MALTGIFNEATKNLARFSLALLPPVRFAIRAGNHTIAAGNPEFPRRVYLPDQPKPNVQFVEGENIAAFETIDIPAGPTETIVGLSVDGLRVIFWTEKTAYIYLVESTASNSTVPIQRCGLPTGLLNQRCLLSWSANQVFYVGSDFNIYASSVPTEQSSGSNVRLQAEPLSKQISSYLRRYADLSDTLFANSYVDFSNSQWWIWLKNKAGYMQAFVWDLDKRQMTGPIDLPGFVGVSQIGAEDGRFVGITPSGNLIVLDLRNQLNDREEFDNAAPLTLLDGTDPAPVDLIKDDGFGYIVTSDNKYVRKGQVIRAASGWIRPAKGRNRFSGVRCDFTTVRGSAGQVCFKFSNETGQTVTRAYGEVFGRQVHHRTFLLSGQSFQWEMIILVGEDKPFAIRDLAIELAPSGVNI